MGGGDKVAVACMGGVCLYAPRPDTCTGGDTPGTPFRACACSWLFAWHVAWLSVMQLRHYLFIGTLNPQLEHLARGDHALGKAWWRGGHGGDPQGWSLVPDAVPSPQ